MITIGIAGGMGPHAGVDLHHKILENTVAGKDQDYPPIIHVSFSHLVEDRTGWLFSRDKPSPVPGIFHTISTLDRSGATVIGIPCNTAHVPDIFAPVTERMAEEKINARLLHMPHEVAAHLKDQKIQTPIGILATRGTYKTNLYQDILSQNALNPLVPDEDGKVLVDRAIYDPDWGIKAQPAPVSSKARQHLLTVVRSLRDQGARHILLACTELPLALPESNYEDVALIDNTNILARALLRETYPNKLKQIAI